MDEQINQTKPNYTSFMIIRHMCSMLSLPGMFAFLSPVTQQQLQVPVPTALNHGNSTVQSYESSDFRATSFSG